MCGSPHPFARAVGGCAGAVCWERLTRPSEPVRAAGWRRASIFFACTAAALPLPAEKAMEWLELSSK